MKTTAAARPAGSSYPSSGSDGPGAHGFRVLLANGPRSYREALAAAVRAIGPPGAEVFLAAPEDLDREVHRLLPHVVVCSRLSRTVEALAAAWVELYPGDGQESRVGVRGGRAKNVDGLELPGLMSVIERAEKLAAAA